MSRFGQTRPAAFALVAALVVAAFAQPARAQYEQVIRKLNSHGSIDVSEELKSYRLLFDAYLKMTPPPMEVGIDFNMNTIHAQMPNWSEVAGWAESNTVMADAILNAIEAKTQVVGLPYGVSSVSADYRDAGLMVDVASSGTLRRIKFNYLPALDTIEAYVAAEIYRLMEAGRADRAMELAIANAVILRQFCDRDFLEEKAKSIDMLSDALGNMRDVMYLYLDVIPPEYFHRIAFFDMRFLRPDRNRLFMPEADRIVAEQLIRDVFDETTGQPDPDAFRRVFAAIQAEDMPLTRFGAAKRWAMIASVHGSLDASMDRLTDVYDDWWRRWRVEAYDAILDVDPYYEQTNPVRYAAVISSMKDIADLFSMRNRLILEVRGTAIAAAICGYQRQFNAQPRTMQSLYAQFMHKSTDADPYDYNFDRFVFYYTDSRTPIDTQWGRVWVEPGRAMVWGRGQDHVDNRAKEHTDDGVRGDIVVWPPVKALARQEGLID